MDSTTLAADRRIALRRVGAAAIAAFLALLLLGATRGPAAADSIVPSTAPATTQPAQPQQTAPPDPDHDGFGPRRGGGRPGGDPGGGGDPSGAAPAAPSTGGGETT